MGRFVQTLACAYAAICSGEQPWVALGDFRNEWFDGEIEQRFALVADPISIPLDPTEDQYRWAVFCAASAEWLCARYAVPCPAWALNPGYQLAEPWFDSPNVWKAEVREWLLATTPEPFARRNIFCGDRVFANKYEWAEEMRARRA